MTITEAIKILEKARFGRSHKALLKLSTEFCKFREFGSYDSRDPYCEYDVCNCRELCKKVAERLRRVK